MVFSVAFAHSAMFDQGYDTGIKRQTLQERYNDSKRRKSSVTDKDAHRMDANCP